MRTASDTQVQAPVQSVSRSKRTVAAATLCFGLGVVFLTGFSPAEAVHNAAHDTRHAMAFPCH
jgi:cobalt transporter subunit CbtB